MRDKSTGRTSNEQGAIVWKNEINREIDAEERGFPANGSSQTSRTYDEKNFGLFSAIKQRMKNLIYRI